MYKRQVHGLCPQRSPVGQEQGPVIGEAQLLPGLLPGIAEEIPPHRGARDYYLLRVVVVGAALLKAHHHAVHHLGQGLGGQTGDRIGLVDRGGDPPPGGLADHGEGGISPRSHHQVGLELVQNGPGLLFGALHIDQRPQVVGHVRRGERAAEVGDGDGANLIALLGHQLVLHAPVCPYKQNAAAGVLFLKDMGQRHRRIDVSGGAAAGKQDIHRNHLVCVEF